MQEVKDQLKNLTDEPGVYIFRNNLDRIIYIGKAKSLKSRVRSYWNKSSWKDRPKLGILVPKVTSIETIVTKTEKEALILESNLVFKHQPRYNVLLKANDKQYPWLVITYDEPFPRLIPVREVENFKSKQRKKGSSRNKFFGPYTNVSAMYENLTLVNELFPLRKKRVPPFKDRPCLNYDLGKCLGPCQGKVTEEEYQTMLDQVEMILNGRYHDLKEILEKEMYRYSENQEYEKAAKARDRIVALQTFNEVQNVVSTDINLDQDVFALVIDESYEIACLQIFKTRGGKLINRDTVDIELEEQEDDKELLATLLEQYYSKIPDSELPKEILLSEDIQDSELYSEWLSERKEQKVKVLYPQRGDKLAQVKLARRNGKVLLEKIKLELLESASKNINVALENLARELDLRQPPQRIECYDISHIQGSHTVASGVCFIDGMPAKDQYRRYKISQDQNNDFDSMNEVIARRFKKHLATEASKEVIDDSELEDLAITDQVQLNNPESLPDLVIIDGGKGQLNAALEAIQKYGVEHIKTVGIAKKEEEIYLPGESRPLVLDRRSPELFLVQRVRNEAHRYAITYHRKLRSKRSFRSRLEDVPGLGPKKRQLLLKEFDTLTKIKEASLEEIAELKGFTEKLAKSIKDYIS